MHANIFERRFFFAVYTAEICERIENIVRWQPRNVLGTLPDSIDFTAPSH